MISRIALAASLLTVAATGCGGFAHTPDEFKAQISGSSFGRVDHLMVQRPFADVFKDIQKNAERCLNLYVHKQGHGGNYNIETTTTRLSPTRGQSVARINGVFYLVTDIEARGKPATEVTFFGGRSDGFRPAYENWSRGTNSDCPDF